VDHGPGLLEPFLNQLWTLLKGVGLRIAGLASRIGGLLDWLADLVGWGFKKSPLVPFENLPKKASPKAGEGLRKKTNVKCTPEDLL